MWRIDMAATLWKQFSIATMSVVCISPCLADGFFLQWRSVRSRPHLGAFDYRTSKSETSTTVLSRPAVPAVTVGETTVKETRRHFVIPDAVAGPIRLSGVGAIADLKSDSLVISGTLSHNGGPSGQQQGGKAVIRVEALAGLGRSVAGMATVKRREVACWVRRLESESVRIPLTPHSTDRTDISAVTRVRLVIEYHPNR